MSIFDIIREELMKLTQIVEQKINESTIQQKITNENIKSLKVDLTNCLEIQKDTVKSFFIMKKNASAVKKQMFNGKNFFNHKISITNLGINVFQFRVSISIS